MNKSTLKLIGYGMVGAFVLLYIRENTEFGSKLLNFGSSSAPANG